MQHSLQESPSRSFPLTGRRRAATRLLAAAVLLASSFAVSGQAGSVVGSLPANAGWYYPGPGGTIVDFGSPSREGGWINTITVQFMRGDATDCSGNFIATILRPSPALGTYETVLKSEPFDGGDDYVTIEVPDTFVEPGDVIAITTRRPTIECGSPAFADSSRPGTLLGLPGELPATGSLQGAEMVRAGVMAARASWSGYTHEGVIPIVGSAAGANGSFFRTSIQLTNQAYHTIYGTLGYLPANTPDADYVKFLDYELESGQTMFVPDLGQELGVSGVGSVDVYSLGSAMPLITTRVFNDLGANGTLGFTEPVVMAPDIIARGEQVYFTTPSDVAKYRMNVGIRTIAEETKVFVRHLDEDGFVVAQAEKTYAPYYFEQVPLSTFVGGTPVANGSVEVWIEEGQAVIYASTTDNKTNDSSMTIASRPE